MKSCKSHEKTKNKKIKMLDLLMKNWKLRVWSSSFHFFFLWFARFQILIWTQKHLARASCTELTLKKHLAKLFILPFKIWSLMNYVGLNLYVFFKSYFFASPDSTTVNCRRRKFLPFCAFSLWRISQRRNCLQAKNDLSALTRFH